MFLKIVDSSLINQAKLCFCVVTKNLYMLWTG